MEAYRDQYATLFNNGKKVVVLGISVDPDTVPPSQLGPRFRFSKPVREATPIRPSRRCTALRTASSTRATSSSYRSGRAHHEPDHEVQRSFERRIHRNWESRDGNSLKVPGGWPELATARCRFGRTRSERDVLLELYDAAIAAASPGAATTRAGRCARDRPRAPRRWIYAFGKAALPMAASAVASLARSMHSDRRRHRRQPGRRRRALSNTGLDAR